MLSIHRIAYVDMVFPDAGKEHIALGLNLNNLVLSAKSTTYVVQVKIFVSNSYHSI